jgi:hypothetical protein
MPAPRLHTIPFALGSDGSLILNVTSAFATRDIEALLREAVRDGRTLFVGVVLDGTDRREAVRRLDNAGAETAALLSGRARKPRARKRPLSRRPKTARARKEAP